MNDPHPGPPAEQSDQPLAETLIPASTTPRGWGLPLVLAIALAAASWALVSHRMSRPAPPAGPHEAAGQSTAGPWIPAPGPDAAAKTVSLSIDFGNGARREFAALPWREKMTVGDLMRQTRDFRPGIAYEVLGEGAGALLTSLEGVANQSAGGPCWLYRVGDQPGQVSFDIQPLSPGDRVLWEFRQGE